MRRLGLGGGVISVTSLLVLLAACGPQVDLSVATHAPFEQRLRPTQAGAIFTYEPDVTMHSYDSIAGHFKVWYVTSTVDHVPLTDADDSGVPDYVELVGERYDSVYHKLIDELGFRPPLRDTDPAVGISDDGGDDRFDVYLIDFGGAGDGAFGIDGCRSDNPDRCAGHMAQENDFRGYGYPDLRTAVTVLSSHEFFHAIQAAYDAGQDTWWSEATAVWSEETFDPSQNDFENFLPGYFDETDRSIDVPPIGSVDVFSYAMGILPEFLDERYDEDIVRKIWQELENGVDGVADPEPIGAMDRVLNADYQSGFVEAFSDFAVWNTLTSVFADPERSYANGAAYPLLSYEWQGELPLNAEGLRVYHASTQYFHGELNGREQVTASFVEAPPEGLRLALMLEYGADRDGPYWIDDAASENPLAIDATGYDSALLIVVNTATEGRSAQPSLCFGSPEEVHICRFGEGSGGDASPNDSPPDDVGGCAAFSGYNDNVLILFGIFVVVARRRRR